MLSSSQLKKFHFNPPRVGLKRDPEIQKKYDEFLKNPENLSQFLEKVKVNMDVKQKYFFMENTFPYWTEEKIEHKVCWFKDEDPVDIYNELKDQYEIISCWRNTPANCSIQEIKHLHVFVRIE